MFTRRSIRDIGEKPNAADRVCPPLFNNGPPPAWRVNRSSAGRAVSGVWPVTTRGMITRNDHTATVNARIFTWPSLPGNVQGRGERVHGGRHGPAGVASGTSAWQPSTDIKPNQALASVYSTDVNPQRLRDLQEAVQ